MPIVQIHLIEGRTVDQKRALVEKVTAAVCETVNVTPEHVKIILSDMAKHDYAIGGVLKLDAQK
ncbi:4-oxalocrotonate tautomerase [Micavibrio aeruginosavorus]|uniref:Tautomerase n=1 Tax=Micavibrio aeruginosavorus (strain ARL-13) TaxID=856793 RepID=G2KMD7_MICAA|nr:4-oxalocrotonate tautomerase [Micavibrio aeruginosavorus]AEP10231.1 4-oxalocrotonate tautomerase [Micavibrio aeruginosavorus ARL-13]